MPRVAFATLGCKANQYDTAAVEDSLGARAEVVDFAEPADVYVVNTCTVTHRADADARQLIRKARRQNPDARVIVTGCYAQTQPEVVAAVGGVDLVIGNSHKDDLPRHILEPLDATAGRVHVEALEFKRPIPELPGPGDRGDRTRAFVKIQDGCDYSCSFCIITIARGANTSVPIETVVRQIQVLEHDGVKEVVLTGVQIGRYGRDLETPLTLEQALRQVLAETQIGRIRLSSIDPREFTPGLIELVTGEQRICPHLHIPIQSGDDAILLLMKRDHDRALMRDLFTDLRRRRPELLIGSDVIVGFPGEGPSEFDMTIDFVEQWIDHVHAFSYSDRPGTKAAAMDDKVPADVIRRRSEVLRQLGDRKRAAFGQRLVGSVQPLLVENRQVDDAYLAYTPHYIPVSLAANVAQPNEIVPCTIRLGDHGLVGERAHAA